MALDGGGGALEGADALDHIRIQGSLSQELRIGELLCCLPELIDELVTDGFPFLFRFDDSSESFEKSIGSIDETEVELELVLEDIADLLRFPFSQHPIVDEETGQPISDGLVNQKSDHGRVHTSRKSTDHPVVTDRLADLIDTTSDVILYLPVSGESTDAVEEVVEDLAIVLGMCDFGVKLQSPEL